MIVYAYRLLLASSAAYLALQPTNAATYGRSLTFGLTVLFGMIVGLMSLAGRGERVPFPGWGIVTALFAWCAWDAASYFWSVSPVYTAGELRREVAYSLLIMSAVYVAARDAVAWRTFVGVALASFALLATLAVGSLAASGAWDAGHWHAGVGAFSTYVVLVAPLLLTLLAPPPTGFGGGPYVMVVTVALLALVLVAARLADNRMVWIALAVVFATASALAAARWHVALRRAPLRWLAPLIALLMVLGLLFAQTAREKAAAHFPPHTSVAETFAKDPRLQLWERTLEVIRERPWTGYGFGKSILADELRRDLQLPELSHAHNVFMSQWLQTGAIGLAAFVALLAALTARYVRFLRSADDVLAFLGVIGIALVAGFVTKNLTDDFLFRSNGKEFWILNAALLGFGMRRADAGMPASRPGWRRGAKLWSARMPARNAEAIIINCSTKEQTALALVSALRHASLPVTVIDCESTDGSRAFFRKLQDRLPFTLTEMPLRRHGESLDRLFRESDRDALLLLDSDAELLRGDVVPAMRRNLEAGACGSGFLHRGGWLGANHLVDRDVGYYAPRMWIPCVMLAVAPVRAALAAGESFRARVVCNEIPQLPWLARLLYLRFRVPGLRRVAFEGLRGLRRSHFGVRPHYVYYDTGATLYDYLTQQRQLSFADLGADLWPLAVRHCHGVTRRRLSRRMRNAADVERTRREAVERIETLYGVAVPELRA